MGNEPKTIDELSKERASYLEIFRLFQEGTFRGDNCFEIVDCIDFIKEKVRQLDLKVEELEK